MKKHRLNSFLSDRSGNMAMFFAIAMSAIVPIVYFSIQFRSMEDQKHTLQQAADAAAISVIREVSLINADQRSLLSVANTYIDTNLSGNREYLAEPRQVSARVITAGAEDNDTDADVIEIVVTQLPVADYQILFGFPRKTPITVRTRATQVGGANICVIALNETRSAALSLNQQASLSASNCLVFSNSSHSSGLEARGNAKLQATGIFTGGGVGGLLRNFDPEPIQDYPPVADPLIDRQPPKFLGCDFENVQTRLEETIELTPGVYCGGIRIQNEADVTFAPGVYILKDGPLEIMHNSVARGEGVGFYLTGNGSVVRFFNQSTVSLSAPVDGPMAGLLFFESRDRPFIARHTISSANARSLVGTIYMPKGNLVIDTNQPIADQSEYTAIVANQIQLIGEPKLIINTDYDGTDVPVPAGLGPQASGARIVQ